MNSPLVLIDFGKARFIPDINPSAIEEIAPGMTLSVLSPWHLQRRPLAPRDDLFRMFEVFLNLLDTGNVMAYFDKLDKTNPEELAHAKQNRNLVNEAKILENVVFSDDEEKNLTFREMILSKVTEIHELVTVSPPSRETYDNILTIARLLLVPLGEKLKPEI